MTPVHAPRIRMSQSRDRQSHEGRDGEGATVLLRPHSHRRQPPAQPPWRGVILPVIMLCVLAMATGSCRKSPATPAVRIFHAAGFAPVIDPIGQTAQRDLHLTLQTEGSGSQEACRKLTELGRPCDLLILADPELVAEMLGGVCSWRIDFATDELVLGVGARAPHVEDAEKLWPAVVLRDDVRLARVNENLGPIGYRTLLALKLQERLGDPQLHDRFVSRCQVTVDDVQRLPPLLAGGQIDYAIVYRSTCVAHGIRFIDLDPRVNLGSPDIDYSHAEASFAKLKSGQNQVVKVRGRPIAWCLAQPHAAESSDAAFALIQHLLADPAGAMPAAGLRPLARPRFFGPRADYARFQAIADYAGELK